MVIQLRSYEDTIHPWPGEIWEHSGFLREMVDGLLPGPGEPGPLYVPIRGEVLDELKAWIIKCRPPEGRSWWSHDHNEMVLGLLRNSPNVLVPLLHACDYLEVKKLLKACRDETVRVLEGATPEEIAETFNAKLGDDPFDGFPRSLKLEVISRIDCNSCCKAGRALLDVVPEVCEDWKELARDPEAWMKMRVFATFDIYPHHPAPLGENDHNYSPARVIRQAPALKDLWVAYCTGNEVVHEAIRECKAIVQHEIHIYTNSSGIPIEPAILDVVRRSRSVLQILRISLHSLPDLPRDSEGQSVWEVLAGLENLERLEIYTDKSLPYASELAGKLTRLTWLRFVNDGSTVDNDMVALLRDLIQAGGDTLRTISLHFPNGVDPVALYPLMPSLERCVQVKELVLPAVAVDMAAALPKASKDVEVCLKFSEQQVAAMASGSAVDDLHDLTEAVTKGKALREKGFKVEISDEDDHFYAHMAAGIEVIVSTIIEVFNGIDKPHYDIEDD